MMNNHEDRVTKQQMGALPKSAAVDADGTLWEDNWEQPIGAGWVNWSLIKKLIEKQKEGWKLILWTCRGPESGLDEAIQYCGEQGLFFDAVNDNLPEVQAMFGMNCRKVYATVYIDDKNLVPIAPNSTRNKEWGEVAWP
jgi:hypothetical protein